MKKIMILGASMLQVPAIRKAKEKGLYVIVLDYNPQAVGIAYADEFLCISTIDKEKVYEAALKYKPDYIMTSTSDMPVRTVAWVNEKLHRKTDISYEDSICATNKASMRMRMQDEKVPIPEYHIINSKQEFMSVVENMPMHFIVKPADNAASRGVIFVDKRQNPNYDEIFEFSKQYSREGEILIEEFMKGPEVSVEAFTINGNTEIITVTDKLVTELPFFVELGHTEPSRLSDEVLQDICNVAMRAIKALKVQNGPTHTEIKVTENGAKLVEIAARLGGDFITSKLVPLSTGVDLTENCINSVIGEKVDVKKKEKKGAAIRFVQGKEGIITSIIGVAEAEQMKGVIEVEIYKKLGDRITKLENSSDRIGHVIAIGNTADEAEENCERALSYIKIISE